MASSRAEWSTECPIPARLWSAPQLGPPRPRCLRNRLYCPPWWRPQLRHCPVCLDGSGAAHAPRRSRCRWRERRWRGVVDLAPAAVLPCACAGTRHRTTRDVRGWLRVSSRLGGRRSPRSHRSGGRYRTPSRARVAPRPREHRFARPPRARNHAGNLAVFCRTVPFSAWDSPIRVAFGSSAQARGIAPAAAILHLFAFLPDHRVQGPPHALAVSAVLRRFARPIVRDGVRRVSSALFDEHAAILASGAAVPLRRAQRRDQYHRLEPALAAHQAA